MLAVSGLHVYPSKLIYCALNEVLDAGFMRYIRGLEDGLAAFTRNDLMSWRILVTSRTRCPVGAHDDRPLFNEGQSDGSSQTRRSSRDY